MDRRHFIALSAAALVVPVAGAAGVAYRPGSVEKRLSAGETVFLDFKASWCSTCAAQERVINALRKENPAYDAAITFVDVDWDQFKRDALTKRLKVPRRSTLIVLKGNKELGRIIAGTGKAQIKSLMDTALSAATA